MEFPNFFRSIPALLMRDPLAELLGAAEGGIIEYHYEDVVKLAGHSCPTVAGAWLMAKRGLATLYPNEMPTRGSVRVDLKAAVEIGTAGVVGNVLGFVTGAAGEGGFKGLGGIGDRRGLLRYGQPIDGIVRLARTDNDASVLLDYFPDKVTTAHEMTALMSRVLSGRADADEHRAFAQHWQDRVRRILLEHGDDPDLVRVRMAPG